MDFDPKYLDFDFHSDHRFVFGDTTPKGETFAGMREYGDVFPITPQSQWQGLVEQQDAAGGANERMVTMIFDQGQEGSCVANASSQAHQIVQAMQWGKDKVIKLSAISLYKRIGSTAQSGANVSDALDELQNRGILPLDTPENRTVFGDKVMAPRGFSTKYPDDWQTTAKRFCVAEALIIKGTDQMGSALLNGHPVVVGRQGHSICYVALKYKGGSFYVPYANSWREDWGQAMGDMPGGFGVDSWRTVQQASQWAYAITQIVDYRAA